MQVGMGRCEEHPAAAMDHLESGLYGCRRRLETEEKALVPGLERR